LDLVGAKSIIDGNKGKMTQVSFGVLFGIEAGLYV